MAKVTRRTHIVRISDAKPGEPPSDTYVDVEVLDAIAFRIENNKEVILDLNPAKVKPYIVDATGGGNGKTTESRPTRLSHMERVKTSGGSAIDIEVIDAISFRLANGAEWILSMPKSKVASYNTTTGEGSTKSTRRVHDEKIAADLTESKPTDYITVQRSDTIGFRTEMGKEVILKIPSSDDVHSSAPRASTHVTPAGYDPTNDDGPKPPPNSDPNIYVSFPAGSTDFFTGDIALAQGPLWWIRKVSAPPGVYVVLTTSRSGNSHGNHLPSAPFLFLSGMAFDPSNSGLGDIFHINYQQARDPFPVNGADGKPSKKDDVNTARWGGNEVVDTLGYVDGTTVHDLEVFSLKGINAITKASPPKIEFTVQTQELHAVDEGGGGGGTQYFIWGSWTRLPGTAYPDDTFPTFDESDQDFPYWLATQPDATTLDGAEFDHIGLFANRDVHTIHPEFGSPPFDPGYSGTFPDLDTATAWAAWAAPYMAEIHGTINVLPVDGGGPPVTQPTETTTLTFDLYTKATKFTVNADNVPQWSATPKTRIVKTVGGTAPQAGHTFRATYTQKDGLTVTEV